MKNSLFKFSIIDDNITEISNPHLEHNDAYINPVYDYFLIPDLLGRISLNRPIIETFGKKLNSSISVFARFHNYLPYFYIKIEEISDYFIDPEKNELDLSKVQKFAETSENAINLLFPKVKTSQIIHSMHLKHKLDFYGFKNKKERFLKIFVYKPKFVRKLSEIFQKGIINNYQFKCYEVHFDYNVKFYRDNCIGAFQTITIEAKSVKNQLNNLVGENDRYDCIFDDKQLIKLN